MYILWVFCRGWSGVWRGRDRTGGENRGMCATKSLETSWTDLRVHTIVDVYYLNPIPRDETDQMRQCLSIERSLEEMSQPHVVEVRKASGTIPWPLKFESDPIKWSLDPLESLEKSCQTSRRVGIQEQHTHCTQQSPTICTCLSSSSPRTESSWEYPPSTMHPSVDSSSVEDNERREVKWNPKFWLDPIAVARSCSHLRPYRDEPSASRPIRADKHRRGQRVLTWVTSREHCAAAGFFLLLDPLRPQNHIFAVPYHSWSVPDAPCGASQSLERTNVPHRTTESSTKGYSNYILDPCSFNSHAVPDPLQLDIHEYSIARCYRFQGDWGSFMTPRLFPRWAPPPLEPTLKTVGLPSFI
jgi:hypothetical protein